MATMWRIKRRVYPAVCCLALAGCFRAPATSGMAQLGAGRSTVQNAVALLGQPTKTESGRDGTSILTWDPSRLPYVGDGTPTVIRLTFGSDGKLLSEKAARIDPELVPNLEGP
jgi:hypothetical protein